MKLLSIVHRWAGGFIGLLLAVLGLTGAILVWEGEWILLPGAAEAIVEDVGKLAAVVERAAADEQLSRITFANDEIGLHQVVYADGSGAYVSQDGAVVERWSTQWERPELWLFDLHHHLFAGDAGETVTGIAGFAGLLFVVSGFILWWRSRRAFKARLLPANWSPGAIVSHHRDLGVVAMPLLVLSMLTGIMMLFEPVRLALIGTEERPQQTSRIEAAPNPALALAFAKSQYPDAELRRITLPRKAQDPLVIRMRQPFEWTPNGRTQLSFAPSGNVTIQDASAANRAAGISEKAYPLHSAKVGGLLWKTAMTASGLALAVLGSLAVWSFWLRRTQKGAHRRRRRRRRLAAAKS